MPIAYIKEKLNSSIKELYLIYYIYDIYVICNIYVLYIMYYMHYMMESELNGDRRQD